MKIKLLLTVLIGIFGIHHSISYGAELVIYGSGGVTINTQTNEITVCPNPTTQKCATLIIEGDEIEIVTGDVKANYPAGGVTGLITTVDGQVYNVLLDKGNISDGNSGGLLLHDFCIHVINP